LDGGVDGRLVGRGDLDALPGVSVRMLDRRLGQVLGGFRHGGQRPSCCGGWAQGTGHLAGGPRQSSGTPAAVAASPCTPVRPCVLIGAMRWEAQALQAGDGTGQDGGGTPAAPAALLPLSGLQRSITTPEFAGVTFHEVLAKSALNRVPDSSPMPFRWTVNPYRGCTHACRYCYARGTHE